MNLEELRADLDRLSTEDLSSLPPWPEYELTELPELTDEWRERILEMARTFVPDADAEPAPSNTPADPPPDTPASDSALPQAQGSDDPFGTSGVGYPD